MLALSIKTLAAGMSAIFYRYGKCLKIQRSFNQNIDAWDVSSVTNMSSMFKNAFQFNQPITSAPNRWNVSNVLNFHGFVGQIPLTIQLSGVELMEL